MSSKITVFIIVFFVTLIGNSVYQQMQKDPTPGKAKRLQCQREATTFEKGYALKEIQEFQQILKSEHVPFTSSIEKSSYAKSHLFEYVQLSQVDEMFKKELNSYIKDNKDLPNHFKLSYYVYENDVKDPGKKTKKSKLYAGYIVTKLTNEKNRVIYQSQIDFMDKKGADIAKTVKCSVKSLATFK